MTDEERNNFDDIYKMGYIVSIWGRRIMILTGIGVAIYLGFKLY